MKTGLFDDDCLCNIQSDSSLNSYAAAPQLWRRILAPDLTTLCEK